MASEDDVLTARKWFQRGMFSTQAHNMITFVIRKLHFSDDESVKHQWLREWIRLEMNKLLFDHKDVNFQRNVLKWWERNLNPSPYDRLTWFQWSKLPKVSICQVKPDAERSAQSLLLQTTGSDVEETLSELRGVIQAGTKLVQEGNIVASGATLRLSNTETSSIISSPTSSLQVNKCKDTETQVALSTDKLDRTTTSHDPTKAIVIARTNKRSYTENLDTIPHNTYKNSKTAKRQCILNKAAMQCISQRQQIQEEGAERIKSMNDEQFQMLQMLSIGTWESKYETVELFYSDVITNFQFKLVAPHQQKAFVSHIRRLVDRWSFRHGTERTCSNGWQHLARDDATEWHLRCLTQLAEVQIDEHYISKERVDELISIIVCKKNFGKLMTSTWDLIPTDFLHAKELAQNKCDILTEAILSKARAVRSETGLVEAEPENYQGVRNRAYNANTGRYEQVNSQVSPMQLPLRRAAENYSKKNSQANRNLEAIVSESGRGDVSKEPAAPSCSASLHVQKGEQHLSQNNTKTMIDVAPGSRLQQLQQQGADTQLQETHSSQKSTNVLHELEEDLTCTKIINRKDNEESDEEFRRTESQIQELLLRTQKTITTLQQERQHDLAEYQRLRLETEERDKKENINRYRVHMSGYTEREKQLHCSQQISHTELVRLKSVIRDYQTKLVDMGKQLGQLSYWRDMYNIQTRNVFELDEKLKAQNKIIEDNESLWVQADLVYQRVMARK